MTDASKKDIRKIAPHKGVRKISLAQQAPNCKIMINRPIYDLKELAKNKKVIDIGCGYGKNREIVESVQGEWIGVEPFEGGNHTIVADARNLPFEENTFDIAIMDAVLEHVPEVEKAFSEVARVLKPGGLFIGYAAFMECFHEISYSHLSYKGIEHYAEINKMQLTTISGGSGFGIDYHFSVLMYPLPVGLVCKILARTIRGTFRLKSLIAYAILRLKRKLSHQEAISQSHLYYQIECLRQSSGFNFIIVKNR